MFSARTIIIQNKVLNGGLVLNIVIKTWCHRQSVWTVTTRTDLNKPVTALSGRRFSPRPASLHLKIDDCFFFQSKLNCQVAFPGYFASKCFYKKCTWKWGLKGICHCSWGIQMFSLACTVLFMKCESQGRDCVHLSVICCTLLMPPCRMSFYLAAHQPPKSLFAYIIVLRGRDVFHVVSEVFQWLLVLRTTKNNFPPIKSPPSKYAAA